MFSDNSKRFHDVMSSFLGPEWEVIQEPHGMDFSYRYILHTKLELKGEEVRHPDFDLYKCLIPKLRETLMGTKVVSHYVTQLEDQVKALEADVAKLERYRTHFEVEKERLSAKSNS